MAQRKAKTQLNINQNPIEAVRDIGASVVSSVKEDVAKGLMTDLWNQMLGTEIGRGNSSHTSGDLVAGEELNLKKPSNAQDKKQEQLTHEQKPQVEAGWDYTGEIIHSERRIAQTENRELNAKVSEIIIELKKLTKSSKELEITFREITVEQNPVNPGKYHLNFFEWMLSTIKSARMKIEDSANWTSLFATKKGKKDYWSLFKKHGTSFGLSGERTTATQTA